MKYYTLFKSLVGIGRLHEDNSLQDWKFIQAKMPRWYGISWGIPH